MVMKCGLVLAVAVLALTVGATGSVLAQDRYGAHLSGVQVVPPVFSDGHGFALTTIDYGFGGVEYSVIYFGLGSHVTQVHIHFGREGINGGILVHLCSNLLDPPVGVQNCPNGPGFNAISGVLTAGDVGAGAASQGVAAGDWYALASAIEMSAAYVDVHTEGSPAGAIRGPLGP